MNKIIKDAKELADMHWSYVRKLLVTHDIDESVIRVVEFHYITAFVHGYKHGIEEASK